MNLTERYYEIRQGKEFELKKNSSRIINDYNLKVFFISNKDVQDDNGKYYKAPNLKIVGPSKSIDDIYYKEIKYYINNGYKNNNNKNNNNNNNFLNIKRKEKKLPLNEVININEFNKISNKN